MASARTFCEVCVILLVGLCLVYAEDKKKAAIDEGPRGNCSCGGFPSEMPPVPGAEPLLSQMPGLVTKCSEEGQNTCRDLCLALATATKAKGPEMLCIRLKNALELTLSAFYKTCDGPWTFANMTAEMPLCCEDSKVKVCPSVEAAANATSPVVVSTGKP
ncbi:hypothetical protein NE865_16076 [Phthorimaea operculella]|nr:hypothetical protein NE865_16076 [Phthorimaea operculella]